jgi:hypothetical protein
MALGVDQLFNAQFSSVGAVPAENYVADVGLIPYGPSNAATLEVDGGFLKPLVQSINENPGYGLTTYNTEIDIEFDLIWDSTQDGYFFPVRFDPVLGNGFLLILTSTTRNWFRFDGYVATPISSAAHSGLVNGPATVKLVTEGDFTTLYLNGNLNGQTNVAAHATPLVNVNFGVQIAGVGPAPYTYGNLAVDAINVIGDASLIPPVVVPSDDGVISAPFGSPFSTPHLFRRWRFGFRGLR